MANTHVLVFLSVFACSESRLLRGSLKAPFQQFDGAGTRHLPGWEVQGSTKLRLGSIQLVSDEPGQRGAVWATVDERLSLGKTLGLTSTFRMSSKSDPSERGGSMSWFVDRDDGAAGGGDLSFHGVSPQFYGIAVVLSGGAAGGEKGLMTLWANNGSPSPTAVGSCIADLQYNQMRDDFDPQSGSSLRLIYTDDKARLEIDERNTGTWTLCAEGDTGVKVSSLRGGKLGVVAVTDVKKNIFEFSKLSVYDSSDEASRPEVHEKDRSVQILNMLEHELFEMNGKLSKTLESLESRLDRERETVGELEGRISDMFEKSLENRVNTLEKTVLESSAPNLKLSHEFELKMDDMVSTVGNTQESMGWYKPFIVILFFLGIYSHSSKKTHRTLKRYNSNHY